MCRRRVHRVEPVAAGRAHADMATAIPGSRADLAAADDPHRPEILVGGRQGGGLAPHMLASPALAAGDILTPGALALAGLVGGGLGFGGFRLGVWHRLLM